MFKPSTKPKEKKAMKQKIIGISTILIIAIIVGIVFVVNKGESIEKISFFNKCKVKALASDTVEVKSIWATGIGSGGNSATISDLSKTKDGGILASGSFTGSSVHSDDYSLCDRHVV